MSAYYEELPVNHTNVKLLKQGFKKFIKNKGRTNNDHVNKHRSQESSQPFLIKKDFIIFTI